MDQASLIEALKSSWSRSHRATNAACLVVGGVCPFLVALLYVHTFGVNIPVHDEWNQMPAMESFYSGHGWVKSLVDHYGEHRVPVSKMLIFALAPFTKYNVKAEMYVSVFLMMLCVLVCWKLLNRTNSIPWLLVPIGWLLLSTAQYHNLLVGWQLQIPLMNLFVLLTVYFLSKETILRSHQFAAIASAFAATFSFANGLMIWPAAIYLVVSRDRSRSRGFLWMALSILAVFLYFVGYTGYHRTPNDQTPQYLATISQSPGAVLGLFLAVVGNNFGEGRLIPSLVSGIVQLLIVLGISGAYLLCRRTGSSFRSLPSPKSLVLAPWIALLAFSMMSAVAIALGRSLDWREFATASRYLSVTVFIPISLLVIGAGLFARIPGNSIVRRAGTVAVILLVGSSVYQHWKTVQVGWVVGRATHDQNVMTLPCLLNYRTASDECLRNLYVADGDWVRRHAPTLERWHLGPFTDLPLASQPRESKIEEDPPVDNHVDGTLDLVGIDTQSDGTVLVTAKGWSLIGKRHLPATVVLLLDNQRIGHTSFFYNRPDVSASFNSQLPPSGWTIRAKLKALNRGTHRAQVVLMSASGQILGNLNSKEASF